MIWIILTLVVAAAILLWIGAVKKKKKASVEKYVCDVCHQSECECRRVE